YKPTSPGRRGMSVSTFDEITKDTPEKRLVKPIKKRAGRNNQGRITVRHQGGGHKRAYRLVDFKRNKPGVPARVAAIEYDPSRSAGAVAQLMARDKKYCQVRLPSGEVRYVLSECAATIGQVGNLDHENRTIGKAGRSRWLGKRPTVRGSVMNPRDHPHGGGEGR